MELALSLARRGARQGEVPVGALLVDRSGKVLSAEYNQTITLNDPTAHAEMLCMRKAAAALGNYRLLDTTLYVSLEPCAMCAGALVWARVKRVIFGAPDAKAGALGSRLDLSRQEGFNHHLQVTGGLLADKSIQILQDFFRARRK